MLALDGNLEAALNMSRRSPLVISLLGAVSAASYVRWRRIGDPPTQREGLLIIAITFVAGGLSLAALRVISANPLSIGGLALNLAMAVALQWLLVVLGFRLVFRK